MAEKLGAWRGTVCISVGGDNSVHWGKTETIVVGLFTKHSTHSSLGNASPLNSAAYEYYLGVL